MIKNTLGLLCLFFWQFGTCQTANSAAIASFPLVCDSYIGFDILGNSYYIKENALYKKSDSKLWNYKNISLGKIMSVDIINPLQIVIFYEDFNTTVLLDNQLNEIQKINFARLENPIMASEVRLSGRNQLWFFNTTTQKIGLFNYSKNNSTEFTTPIQGSLKCTSSDFNSFYWIDELNNSYSISIYGQISFLGKIPVFNTVQFIDSKKLLFSIDNKICVFDFTTKSTVELKIVENSFNNFYFKDQILAIFTDQQITNFKIKLP